MTLADSKVVYDDSISDAFSAAADNEGSTLQLLKTVEIENGIRIEKGTFTIDLNGKSLVNNKT